MKDIQTKKLRFNVEETKQFERNGVKIGVVKGHASAFTVDRGNDKIMPNAFTSTLERHIKDNNRPIRLLSQHNTDDLIGGIPPGTAFEDEKGLFITAEINLDVQKGAEAFALAKQGVLSDFSIGFSIKDSDFNDGIRIIKEVELWEVSLVSEPMQADAKITEVKAIARFNNELPIADRGTAWDSRAADLRVREFTDSTESPSPRYRQAFMWWDENATDSFGSYKLQFVDIIDGRMHIVPRAISAIQGVLSGARGGIDLPEATQEKLRELTERYQTKIAEEFGEEQSNKCFIDIANAKDIKSKKEFEKCLRESGGFSIDAAKYLAARFEVSQREVDGSKEVLTDVVKQLREMTSLVTTK